jgi:glycosyltransferase involved in cell wall biosynthesis
MKKIGIDARFYSEAGVGRYIKNLLYYLQKLDHTNEYYILFRKKDFEVINFSSPNFHPVLADIPWYGVAEQVQLPNILYSLKLDLVHFPHFNIPVFYNGKFIVTIHDLIHQKFKMNRATTHDPITYFIKHKAYNFAFSTALKKSEKVITVSDYVEEELIKTWKVKREKIVVTKEGVEENLIENAKKVAKKEIDVTLQKFNIKSPFIFYVGNAHPHKNVEGLIKAFMQLKTGFRASRNDNANLQLVLSGKDHYFWQRIKEEYSDKDIIFTGFVSDEELVALYKSCKAYVVPSFEEGFGIPLLEAMALQTPVVASNTSATPEIGGDAALYFNPKDPTDIADKISEVLNSEKLRKELIEKGEKRVKEFSWKKMVEQTLEVYNG